MEIERIFQTQRLYKLKVDASCQYEIDQQIEEEVKINEN